MRGLSLWDWIFIVLYFLIIALIAYWSSRKADSSEGYFLAGRDVGWLAVGASLFASNIGSEHLVGLAGSGAAGGLAVGHFEWLAVFALLLLGWLFAPFYFRSKVYTMPEFLEKRYDSRSRLYLSIVSIAGYVLTKISVTLFAGGIILSEIMGVNIWTGSILLVIFTGIYTIIGGLSSVIYTEVIQTFLMIGGATLLTILGLKAVGGWHGLLASLPKDYFSMWKPISHPEFPWTGILLGAPILGIWYWCTDQYIVQRVLAAKDLSQARGGTIFAAYLKILPVFLFVLPGVIAAALYPELRTSSPDRALPMLINNLLPVGLKGIVIAGFLAALMSSLASTFNSCSTLLTWDIYRKWKPSASERELVTFGRVTTVILVILGLLWIPMMKYISSQVYVYLQSVQAYIAPPITAVFLLGVLVPWVNGTGAIYTLILGFILGFSRLILELNKNLLPEGSFLKWMATINFLHFAFLLFVVSVIVLLGVSYLTRKHEKPTELTLKEEDIKLIRETSSASQVVASLVVVLLVFVLWWIFR